MLFKSVESVESAAFLLFGPKGSRHARIRRRSRNLARNANQEGPRSRRRDR